MSLRKAEATATVRHNCMNEGYVRSYFTALNTVLTENILLDSPEQVWNMDETWKTINWT